MTSPHEQPHAANLHRSQARPFSAYALTDCGNAERLIDEHGDSIRFCRVTRRWFVWSGSSWLADTGAVVQIAKKTVRSMHQERKQILEHLEQVPEDWDVLRRHAEALARWEMRSEGAGQISAMLRMAESDPRVSLGPQDFDSNPWLLNLPNGSLELDSGHFREHRSEELQTKLAGASYYQQAPCHRWQQFLDEAFDPHPDVIPFLQKAIGYSLTGETREECIFVLAGGGRNGKSTLLGVLHALFRDYAGVAEMDTFLASSGTRLREDIADMRGRRLISSQEPAIKGTFAEATLKWVSGGDRLRARRLYEHAQEFMPSHKLWLAVNSLPYLRADDSASWSRMRVIPFDVSFATRTDRHLKAELNRELSGILIWALEGCQLWRQQGLGSADSVEFATSRWRDHCSGRSAIV